MGPGGGLGPLHRLIAAYGEEVCAGAVLCPGRAVRVSCPLRDGAGGFLKV